MSGRNRTDSDEQNTLEQRGEKTYGRPDTDHIEPGGHPAGSRGGRRRGLDVLKLQRAFLCSYAAVTIRLAEVLRQPPFMAALYAREDKSDPAGWTDPLDLRAKVVRRTRGFGTPATFPICGERGGLPRRGRPIPPGSLAEQAARYGTARYAHDGGYAAIARPVFWKGKLAKVAVIAVPESDSAVLGPQMIASDMPGRRRRPAAATAGPW